VLKLPPESAVLKLAELFVFALVPKSLKTVNDVLLFFFDSVFARSKVNNRVSLGD